MRSEAQMMPQQRSSFRALQSSLTHMLTAHKQKYRQCREGRLGTFPLLHIPHKLQLVLRAARTHFLLIPSKAQVQVLYTVLNLESSRTAVVLDALFNILDTYNSVFSSRFVFLHLIPIGMLIFPSKEGLGPDQIKALQIRGMPTYIVRCSTLDVIACFPCQLSFTASTILSQVAMTVYGSRFPDTFGGY